MLPDGIKHSECPKKKGESMRLSAQLVLLILVACPLLPAQSGRGTVCVAPNPSEPPKLVSPGGYYNPATLTIQIDKRQPIKWPHKESVQIGDLDLSERHLIVLTSDGKRIQSFWLRFSCAMQTIRRLQIEKLNYPNFNPAN